MKMLRDQTTKWTRNSGSAYVIDSKDFLFSNSNELHVLEEIFRLKNKSLWMKIIKEFW